MNLTLASPRVLVQTLSAEKGRTMLAADKFSAGEKVLGGHPSLAWVLKKYSNRTCAYCFKYFDDNLPVVFECGECQRVGYCTDICADLGENSHKFSCQYLRLSQSMSFTEDEDSCLQLCLQTISLQRMQISDEYQNLMQLSGDSVIMDENETVTCDKVFEFMVNNGLDVSIEWIKNIFKKDKECGFALMLPPNVRCDMNTKSSDYRENEDDEALKGEICDIVDDIAEKDDLDTNPENDCSIVDEFDEDNIRGFGIYPELSYCNHSCLPNCIRWDYIDSTDPSITPYDRRCMEYRALYDIEQGSEIFQSYVPIGWSVYDRQDYLMNMFGFQCDCIRCITELKYEALNRIGENSLDNEKTSRQPTLDHQEIDPLSCIEAYLLRHLCDNETCTGTLTPQIGFNFDMNTYNSSKNLKPMENTENIETENFNYICNVCGRVRNYKVFLQSLQR